MAGQYKGPTALAMAHRIRYHGARALARPSWDPVRRMGLEWYDGANALAMALGMEYARHGATMAKVAGALAALSPQCAWDDQVRRIGPFLRAVLVEGDRETLAHPGFYGNRCKARDILLAHDSADPLDVLGGPKVRAFYRAIMGDGDAVTVDRHAVTVALGAPRASAPTARLALEIRRAYAMAARWLKIAPRDLQALVWCDLRARDTAHRSHRHYAKPETHAAHLVGPLAPIGKGLGA